MRTLHKRFKALLTGTFAAALAVAALGVQARDLRYATGFPPGSQSDLSARAYADMVRELTQGEINIKVYPLSLLNFAETSAGLRDGIADIGLLLASYFPSEYPHFSLLADASMQLLTLDEKVRGRESLAYSGALTEFVFTQCPECQADFAQQNQVFTGISGSSPYYLNCNKPARSLDELKGKRLRVAGSHWARWARSVGAQPITMSGNEMLEALKQGVVDCVAISMLELLNFGLLEVVTDVTDQVPNGIFAGSGVAQVNTRVWKSLSTAQRQALLRAAPATLLTSARRYHAREQEVFDAVIQRGGRVHQPDAALLEKTRAFAAEDIHTIADYFTKTYGVKHTKELLARFRPVLEKWVDLVQDIDTEAQLADLYWREIFAKVDAESYGMQ